MTRPTEIFRPTRASCGQPVVNADFPEASCPDGYPAQIVLYNGFADTRACAACLCTPQGAQCTGSITAFHTMNCTLASLDEIVDDNTTIDSPLCVPFNWVSVKYNSTTVTPGTCEVSGGGVEGDVAPTDLITVCCAQ